MKFSESGLPSNKTLEEAFNFSYANTMSLAKEAMVDFVEQINEGYEQNLAELKEKKAEGELSDAEFDANKKELDRVHEAQLKMGPALISRELNKMFNTRRLAPALEILRNSESSSTDLMAAILLVETVRSPVDFLIVVKKFGAVISGMVADLQHLDAYPFDRNEKLAKAKPDVKRAYATVIINNLEQIVAQFQQMKKMNPMHKITFAPGQEDTIFGNVQALWGNDAKLDQRLLSVFNSAASIASSAFHMEVDAQGKLELVKGGKPPASNGPKKPSGPQGPGGGGDDVF